MNGTIGNGCYVSHRGRLGRVRGRVRGGVRGGGGRLGVR